MKQLCVLCHKTHDDTNWKYGEYSTVSGIKYGWFCDRYFKPSTYEFIPQRIKDQRNEYASSLLQPTRGGEWSKEYIDKYGTKKLGITEAEAKRAKPVWKDILKSGWEKSK